MAAQPRGDEIPDIRDVEDLQHYLAEHAGGEPFDYATAKATTLEAADAIGIGDQARAVIAMSKEMQPAIEATVDRATRELAAVEPIHAKRGTASIGFRSLGRVWLDDTDSEHEEGAPYLIKGLFEIGALALIYGPPKCGKSFSMVDWGCHIAAGLSWRGLRTRAGLVVYIAAEAGRSIKRRGRAWRANYVGEARTERIPLVFITESVNLLQPVAVEHLIEQLREIQAQAGEPIVLTILDTFNRCMPGDENSPDQMGKAVDSLARLRDELACAVAVVHHVGKDPTKGSRGHTSLAAAMDVTISIADGVARVEAARDLPAGANFPFSLEVVKLGEDEDGDAITTCVAIGAEHAGSAAPARPGAPLGKNQQLAFDALRRSLAGVRRALEERGDDPDKACIETLGWREEVRKRMKCDDHAFRGRWREALNGLIERGLVRMDGPHAFIVEESK